ncbi:hypothetical protein T484DRAFT_1757726 [Baffinella frigidus]|nr:hypothetical protein T484DRAFT_1757726 [Cryptophyta sp. CCMP2293]|mmetsp:Transcript_41466/g.94426  ORF Transcript_41466/g.94426 Transcript_41466/m.94426 type:complete len:436 (-) Transcript_41466:711-2018(-)
MMRGQRKAVLSLFFATFLLGFKISSDALHTRKITTPPPKNVSLASSFQEDATPVEFSFVFGDVEYPSEDPRKGQTFPTISLPAPWPKAKTPQPRESFANTVERSAVTLSVPQACARAMPDVVRGGYRTKWCHLLIVNAAFLPLLKEWLCRVETLGLSDLLHASVFVATDPSVLRHFEELPSIRHTALWNVTDPTEMIYGKGTYFRLMQRRLHLINDLLKTGQPVFISEVDQALFRDPLKAVDSLTEDPPPSFVSFDDDPGGGRLPCFGFMGLIPGTSLLKGFERLTAEMDRNPQNEQFLFQKILRDPLYNISHSFLHRNFFWNGKTLQGHSSPFFPKDLVLAHANWVVGVQAKIDLLRKKGLFDSRLCTSRNAENGESAVSILSREGKLATESWGGDADPLSPRFFRQNSVADRFFSATLQKNEGHEEAKEGISL